MPLWQRFVIVGAVLVVTAAVARLIDRRIARRELAPEAATRYRVLRRSIFTVILFVGLFSALLVIPQVRAIAGGILASSAVVGLVIGFASQRTIGNFVAGLLIAFTQPIRLGDRVELENTRGSVEEIGLTYTFIRTDEGARLVIPNEKLASDTILNSTIVSREKVALITVQVPLTQDLRSLVEQLRAAAALRRPRRHRPARAAPPAACPEEAAPARGADRRLPGRGRDHRRRGRVRRRGGLRVELRSLVAAPGLDRRELVCLCGQRRAARVDPGREEPAAGRPRPDQPLDAEGDGRDRGSPLLQARRRRLQG